MTYLSKASRLVLVAMAALLLVGALGVASASATEVLKFVPKTHFPQLYTISGGESALTSSSGEPSLTCESVTGQGEVTGTKTATAKLTFKKCKDTFIDKCQSGIEVPEGEIKTGTLAVQLVYTSKEHHEAALDLNYFVPKGTIPQFAKWVCTEFGTFSHEGQSRGSVVAPVTPVNKSALSYTVSLVEAGHHQKPASYETEAGTKVNEVFPEVKWLSSAGWEEAAMHATLTLKTFEAIEIVA